MRWVNDTLPPRPLPRWLLITIRLSTSGLAGIARTLVAVGTVRLAVMFAAVRAAAPRSRTSIACCASGGGGAGLAGAGRVGETGGGVPLAGGAGAPGGGAAGRGDEAGAGVPLAGAAGAPGAGAAVAGPPAAGPFAGPPADGPPAAPPAAGTVGGAGGL